VLEHANSPAIVSRFGMLLYQLLKDNMYMDDVHTGGETVDEVVRIQFGRFFQNWRLTLIKFASNSEVLKQIHEDAQLPNMI